MTPPATARSRAVAALRDVLERGERSQAALAHRERGLAPADRDLLRELVLGVLRWKSALDREISAVSRIPLARLAPNLREILETALYSLRRLDRIPPYAAVSEAVSQARASGGEGAARLVNGVLRGILLLPRPEEPGASAAADELAAWYSHPAFLVARWIERFGAERARQILAADNAPSPVDLLVNPRRGSREALAGALAAESVGTRSSDLSPLALSVLSGRPLRSRLFAEGRFAVQDVGAQALPQLLPAGDTLVDLAAAPGGKSFAAVFLGRADRAIALDRSPERLRRLAENRGRLGAPEVLPAAADAALPPLPAGRFERVLLDAPCSGSGTLRKNPEIRYRVTPPAIARLAAVQETLLAAAVGLLAPGGYLLYATCSLEREENEEAVAAVLAHAPGLELAAIDAPPALRPYVAGPRFRLFPDAHADGFTAHLLRRRT